MQSPEIIIVPIVFLTFYGIIKIFFDYRLKRSLVEKGLVQESGPLLNANPVVQSLNSLKWGFVLISAGAAILLAQYFPRQISDEIMVGLIFLFAGIGFLVYYSIARKAEERLISSGKYDLKE